MDIDISEIERRIQGQIELRRHMLFWEDEAGEYSEVIGSLNLGSAALVDATGSELAAKRTILRQRPSENIIVYRAGGAPRPEDDFLYDIKLSSAPFSCRMEAVWASECGISVELAEVLAVHAKFFNSKDRRSRLAETSLDKETVRGLRLAMLASCAGSRAESTRDAVREVVGKLLAELGRGQDKTLKLVTECGLASCFWSEVADVLGYVPPTGAEPSVEDLALKMIQTRCGDLIPLGGAQLKADAVRVLNDLASSGRTRPAFDALIQEYGDSIAETVDASLRTLDGIGPNDTLPAFDGWIVADMLSRAIAGTLRAADATAEMRLRAHTLWNDRFESGYEAIAAALGMLEGIELYESACASRTTSKELFDSYRKEWYEIDSQYRRFVGAMRRVPSSFRRSADELVSKVHASYRSYLSDLADRWQKHLMDTGSYPPASISSQNLFFEGKVMGEFPRAESGSRVGVIVSDAMRYEVGLELASRLNAGDCLAGRSRVHASCEAMLCMLPSYTQLGMAALLPRGAMEIDPESGNVMKSGLPTGGLANRRKIVEEVVPGAILFQAAEVLESGLPAVTDAPLVMIYHNAIDKRGDSRDTEGEVFAACAEAIEQVASIAGELLRAGCGKVFVTADHGFLYQDQQVGEPDYAEGGGLEGVEAANGGAIMRGRRFIAGLVIPKSDILLEYSSAELSLQGDCRVALPRGISRLRLRGSGARFVHGGASLQEDVVPVVTIKPARGSSSLERTGVQGFLCGRPTITGASILFDVYQTAPCSDKVAPLTVRVGLYAPDNAGRLLCSAERVLELSSTAESSEERRTRVELQVTDDVDDYPEVVLRISSRIGNTNQYRPDWEQRLTVNRAFGNDFDF